MEECPIHHQSSLSREWRVPMTSMPSGIRPRGEFNKMSHIDQTKIQDRKICNFIQVATILKGPSRRWEIILSLTWGWIRERDSTQLRRATIWIKAWEAKVSSPSWHIRASQEITLQIRADPNLQTSSQRRFQTDTSRFLPKTSLMLDRIQEASFHLSETKTLSMETIIWMMSPQGWKSKSSLPWR